MGRLIKSDWYRITRGGKSLRIYLFIVVAALAFPFLWLAFGYGIDEFTVRLYMEVCGEDSVLMLALALVAFGGVLVGRSYGNKTLYYEVMAGNKTADMINSKILVIVPLLSLTFMGGFAVVSFILWLVNGSGNVTQLPLRLFLFFIIMAHLILIGMLPVMIAKSTAGLVISYIRVELVDVAASVALMGMMDNHSKLADNIYNNWLITSQTYVFNLETIDDKFVIGVIGGFIIESLFWYILAYASYKKKNF